MDEVMDKHYLICIDLDGTLLCNDKTIDVKTVEVIKSLSKLGHKVVITTGRPFYSSIGYYKNLGLDTVIVNRNGAHIHLPHNNSINLSMYIKRETLTKIIHMPLERYILQSYLEVRKDIYVQKGNFDFFKDKNYYFEKILIGDSQCDINFATILVCNNQVEEIMKYLNGLDDIEAKPWIHNGEYDTTLIEIYPKGADKWVAIEKITEYYQIPLDNTIAFGDELNDLKMIKYAKVGVAVKNAIASVKKQANIILEYSNNESGVGLFLEKYFNL